MPIYEGHVKTQRHAYAHREEDHVQPEKETEMLQQQAKASENFQQPQKLGESRNHFSLQSQKQHGISDILISDF